MLRLAGALVVLCLLSSEAAAQSVPATEPEKKPLITPPKLLRFVEASYPLTEGEKPVEAAVELD
ncbi:MAG: hypothetical protein WCF10_03760, partial [Polyangiales bacterium]